MDFLREVTVAKSLIHEDENHVLFFHSLTGVPRSRSLLRIVIVGLNNAGKTTILYNLHLGQVRGAGVSVVRHGSCFWERHLGGEKASSWATVTTW